MYHVAIDNQVPYWIYSNRQDDGTMRGPSTSPVPVASVPSYSPAPAGGQAWSRRGRWTRRWRWIAVGAGHRRLRVRLHDPGPGQSRHRLGDLLRQRGDALRRAHAARAVGEPVDPHARLASRPRRSTAATGRRRSRSIRSSPRPSITAARSSSRRPRRARAGT